MDLAGYERAKFELSGLLQSIISQNLAEADRVLPGRARDLLARLAEDRFNLVVVGRFNRGKSSLMNAILGLDRLPMGIVPLTSVITTVSYGTTEKVTLKYQHRRLDSEISLEELPEYVTQEGNPGNCRGVATANIELPADILRRGFYFVDTPGLGSAILENTATTNAFLPEADALLLVTSFESPLSEEEMTFFTRPSQGDAPVFVALNKQDLVTPAERQRAIAFVRDHLERSHAQGPVGVFSISARDALTAKLAEDSESLIASGLPPLEEALVQFLLERKRTVFLSRMCARVEALLDDLPTFPGSPELRRQVQAMAAKFLEGGDAGVRARADATGFERFHSAQLRPCEICAAVDRRGWDFLSRFQYDLATDSDCQTDFATRSGFCCFHTVEYEGLASPYGTCSGYPPLLERLAAVLRSAASMNGAEAKAAVAGLVARSDACPMCAVRDRAEARAVADVAQRLRKEAHALEKLSALCLPHLAAVAGSMDDVDVLRSLFDQQALTLERTAEDMRRFTLKHSALRHQLETNEEETAARRALALVAGRQSVNFSTGQGPDRYSTAPRAVLRAAGEGSHE